MSLSDPNQDPSLEASQPGSARPAETRPAETRPAETRPAEDQPAPALEDQPAPSPEAAPVEDEPALDLDLEQRQLCPDGACIGVIGAEGRCKVCGKQAEPPAEPASPGQPAAPGAEAEASPIEDDDSPPDFTTRRLCSDGACIGVIGPDDHCKVCHKPFSGEPTL